MNNEKIGQFIAQLRKEKQLTQKELAAKLNITDKAVSKWERGLSYPDISLLPSIAQVLGVTTSELLDGEKACQDSPNAVESIDNVLDYAHKSTKIKQEQFQSIAALVFSILSMIGAGVCIICNLAINGALTWSLYPIVSIAFGWILMFPIIKLGKKGVLAALISLTILIIPFLYIIGDLVGQTELMMAIGIRVSIITIAFLWLSAAVAKFLHTRKWLAGGVILSVVVPVYFLINFSLSKIISEPIFDIWDCFSLFFVVLGAIAMFFIDYKINKK